ncbi:unnamed protein product [Hermetia illucens]|uniref:Nucleolar protein 11 n=1 Tax=Hermetia illucens TaxID=343691 RepID=A0A7R8UIJ7_HERIL|nr:unnamed protein product [Hermetia illucens]
MAKFVAFYDLCPIEDIKEFLGLSKDREEGNIVTTLGRNIIIIIKLSTQKQIRSWTVLEKLSTKVVYDPKSEQYVGVFSQQFIRCWTEDEHDVNKKKKIRFQKPILDLLSSDDEETIVLYADGSCEFLSSAIESRKSKQQNENGATQTYPQISQAKIFTLANDSSTGRPLDDPKQYKIDRHDRNLSLIGQAVVYGQNNPFLFTLWSDRRVFTLPLHNDTKEDDSPGNFISMINLLNVDNPVSILGISKNCLAIYGSNSVQEGSSLLLYNTQFRVVNAKQFFKIYFNYSRLWVIGSNILLAMGHNLYVVPFRISKELLSEMIGSQVSNEVQGQVGKELIKEDDELEEALSFDHKKRHDSPKHNNILNDTPGADGKTRPYQPYEIFNEKMNEILGRKARININAVAGDDEFRIDLRSHSNDVAFKTEELEVIAKSLEECGASEQEITEKILTVALKAQLVSDLVICIERYSNISEKLLAKVIKFALNGLSMNDFANLSNAEEQPNINPKLRLLNAALACSIDTSMILIAIKKELNFEGAMLLIQYLYYIMDNNNNVLEGRPELNLNFDEDVQTMQWFSIILNAFFQELGLSKSAQLVEMLTKLKELLQSYQHDMRDLQSVHALISNLIDGKISTKENKHCKWYSIEEVKLF